MQIDWLTVVAQIANFLVLIWLLQRFLYRPITDAMQRREAVIANQLAQAQAALDDATAKAEALRDKKAALEASTQAVLDDARENAQALRQRLEDDLHTEMQARRNTWCEHLAQERDDFANALRRHAGHQVIAITGDLLHTYAQTDLSGPLVSGFIARLADLDDQMRQKLMQAAKGTESPALVETSVAFRASAKSRLTRAIHKACATDIEVHYAQDEAIVLGLRLSIGTQTVEWSAAQHLKRLDTALDEVIDSTGITAAAQGS
ncbi:F0F1 ATP synthase subunit delta [Yoonia sp.]|uniref:F0F1 ATP synthase subunit delta n=1 Tax=Yoonia sp. TaxID=2212373 RepID=UPI0019E4BE4D|nr:F0F1 ATP synthase subunit delta [Yoonia sp.]MBE0413961.1 F0F1 ATP synthase subunit delta [Yoonia sp.]